MISVENFYFMLHQHLLKPLGIQDLLYHKFGSTNLADLAIRYMETPFARDSGYVWKWPTCYFCDQEPLTEKIIYQTPLDTRRAVFKILANSEHSALKKKAIQKVEFLDWYYFFHGFAALDWFNDAQYFDQDIDWSRSFISLNRLCTGDRSYRLNLIARLVDCDIVDHGHVSLHLDTAKHGDIVLEIDSEDSQLSKSGKQLIKQNICAPMYLDHQGGTSGDLSADFGHQEFKLWKSGLWHVVTETVFYHNKLHLTEKIFKPIVAQRPFVLAAAPGNLAYLRGYGFKTFDRWIDESYDDIADPDLRLQAIVNELKRICALSQQQLKSMHMEMQEVLEYNFNHFFNQFKKIIVNELVDNFETCVRIWNNGRVDDRILPLEKLNLIAIKKIFAR